MKEKIEPGKKFVKNRDNLGMLKKSLTSEKIDTDLIPILKKFFSLPITPHESCYGHIKERKQPYLSLVDDKAYNEQEKNIQKTFREKIIKLGTRINKKIGTNVIEIVLEETYHESGPKDYTLYFKIKDEKTFQELNRELLVIIWEEFSKYIDEIKSAP